MARNVIRFTVTSPDNIDFDKKELIDKQNFRRFEFGIFERVTVIDLLTDLPSDITVVDAIAVNAFDHLLVVENFRYKILHCLIRQIPDGCAAFPL